jgi:UDP-N-acetylmuramoyl-L-alanyl-D-glutamate--2,6-diaminopimelate ligase
MRLAELQRRLDFFRAKASSADLPSATALRVTDPQNPLLLGVSHDSRLIEPGWLYVVLPGRQTHGAHYLPQALERGAVAVALPAGEVRPSSLPPEYPTILLQTPRREMAHLAEWIWGEPLSRLTLIGLTGTNGKTTTSSLLAQMIARHEGDVGLLGTVVTAGGGIKRDSQLTTLESPALHQHFQTLVNASVQCCVMEVSSIGIAEERVAAARFARAAFLNLSEDHLDYHGDMARYGAEKLRLFTERLTPEAIVVINMDDPFSATVDDVCRRQGVHRWRFSARMPHGDPDHLELFWRDIHYTANGLRGVLQTPTGPLSLSAPLLGDFNATNLAIAVALARSLEVSDSVIQEVSAQAQVRGRMERIPNDLGALILVDYAHSPDALERALKALRPHCEGRLWCLFGCGGDRDPHKRAAMGEASTLADGVILTTDNPRYEDPIEIASQALVGIERCGYALSPTPRAGAVRMELDRARAIVEAVSVLRPGDLLLIAGKGHETYQEIRGTRLSFDDVEQLQSALSLLSTPAQLSGEEDRP